MKPDYIKITALGLALIGAALNPVSTAGVTGSFETVPIIQSALAALPVNTPRDLAVLNQSETLVETLIIADTLRATKTPSQK